MKKFLIILAGIILLLLIAVVSIPFLFKDRIVQMVKDEANKNVNAVINFDNDISLSLISSFPDFSIGIKNLTVIGKDTFDGDTLISLKEFEATLDLMSVINGGQIKIREIMLDEPHINAIVTSSGKANWDIARPSADTAAAEADTGSTNFDVALKLFKIQHAYINYDDRQGGMKANVNDLNYTLEGDFSQDNFLMKMLTEAEQVTFGMSGITYLSKVKTRMKADIDADMKNMKFTFKENEIGLNELVFSFDGSVAMKDEDIIMDLKYAAAKSEFRNFLSLIPAIYSKDFKDLQSSGKLAFDGFAKGTYNEKRLPAFAFRLLIENGMFKYPALPTPVNNVQVNLAVTNPDGNLDNTKVDLSKLHFDISGDPFDAKMVAVNVIKDPDIDASLTGRLNLDNVVKIVPLEDGMKVSGLIISDFHAKGRVSEIEKKNYENFSASGSISAQHVQFASKDLPQGMNLKQAQLDFSTKAVALKGFDATIGKSDMQMDGELTNFFPYFFGKGVLNGTLSFRSNVMDANQFMSQEPEGQAAQADTASATVAEVPADINFTLTSSIGKLLYTNMEITNLKGVIRIADRKLSFSKIGMNTLGATITMDGFYETSDPKKPSVEMDFGIQNLDIQKAFVTFNTVKRIAPIAEKTSGSFSTSLHMVTRLDSKMSPLYESLFATGTLSVPHAEVQNVAVFEKLADALKKPEYKKLALDNVRLDYKVENGRIYTKPFDVKVAGQKLNLSGSTGLDQTIDYTGKVAIPKKDLGAVNSALEGALASLNKQAGTSLKMNEMVNVGLTLGGTFTKPTVSTNLADVVKSETSALKDQAAAELERRKKEVEEKARAEADRLKREAESRLKAEQDKAKAEADRLKREAEDRAKKEQERLKKQAEEEAKKKLKGLFGK